VFPPLKLLSQPPLTSLFHFFTASLDTFPGFSHPLSFSICANRVATILLPGAEGGSHQPHRWLMVVGEQRQHLPTDYKNVRKKLKILASDFDNYE
jgi:hypothetical protein